MIASFTIQIFCISRVAAAEPDFPKDGHDESEGIGKQDQKEA
jgi:hypothetical protein